MACPCACKSFGGQPWHDQQTHCKPKMLILDCVHLPASKKATLSGMRPNRYQAARRSRRYSSHVDIASGREGVRAPRSKEMILDRINNRVRNISTAPRTKAPDKFRSLLPVNQQEYLIGLNVRNGLIVSVFYPMPVKNSPNDQLALRTVKDCSYLTYWW